MTYRTDFDLALDVLHGETLNVRMAAWEQANSGCRTIHDAPHVWARDVVQARVDAEMKALGE